MSAGAWVCTEERFSEEKGVFNFYRELILVMADLVSNIWHSGCLCTVLGRAAGAPQKCACIPRNTHLAVVAVGKSRFL